MKSNPTAFIKPALGLASLSRTASAATAVVDTRDYRDEGFTVFLVNLGAIDNASTLSLQVQEDTDVNMGSPASVGPAIIIDPTTEDNSIVAISVRNGARERYLRLNCTYGGANAQVYGVTNLSVHGKYMPMDQTFAYRAEL